MEDYDDEPDPAEELEREEWIAEVTAAAAAPEAQPGGAPLAVPEVLPPPPGAATPKEDAARVTPQTAATRRVAHARARRRSLLGRGESVRSRGA